MLIKYDTRTDVIDWRDIRISKDLAQEKLCDGEIKIVWYEGAVPDIVAKDGYVIVFRYNEKDGLYIDYEPIPVEEINYSDQQEIMQYLNDIELRLLELNNTIEKGDA